MRLKYLTVLFELEMSYHLKYPNKIVSPLGYEVN